MIASLLLLKWLFLQSVLVDKAWGEGTKGGTVVQVSQGKLMGLEMKSVNQKTAYYSFQGIPFAQPPVGELRFMVGRQFFANVLLLPPVWLTGIELVKHTLFILL